MKYFVGVTDNDWFRFLANLGPEEVNFWRPSPTRFRAVSEGAPFLFKLHSPEDFIVGGGFLVKFERLPLSLAWDAFGRKNGLPDFDLFARKIASYRRDSAPDPTIGCLVLNEPFFFAEDQWIPVPGDWSPNIVTGKSYDTSTPAGRRLWAQVEERLLLDSTRKMDVGTASLIREGRPLFGREYLHRSRLGQGAFRVLVTSAYGRRCSISGERTLPVLEAAHIKPHSVSGPNRVNNGLLLRSDFHILFDRGYLTVTPDLTVVTSRRIKDEFDNGREYLAFHGRSLESVPENADDSPDRSYLEWHNQRVFTP
jgi:putative restriction endonuclease